RTCPPREVSPSIDRTPPLQYNPRRLGHHACFAVFEDDHVLDADAAPAGDVDAGLDGDDHAVLQFVVRKAGETGSLVNEEADTVAKTVAEVLAEAGLCDYVVGEHVGLLAGHSRAD